MPELRAGLKETPESKKEEQTCQSSHIKQRGEVQLGTQIFHLRAPYLFFLCLEDVPGWLCFGLEQAERSQKDKGVRAWAESEPKLPERERRTP